MSPENTPRIVLITGANRGIGLEAAKQLAGRGFHVIIAARNEESGHKAAEAITTDGGKASFLPLDVSSSESILDAAGRIPGIAPTYCPLPRSLMQARCVELPRPFHQEQRIKEQPMFTRWCVCCLAGLIAVTACAADEQKESAKLLADKIAAIKKDHQERKKTFYDALGAARNDNKKVLELNDEYHKVTAKQAEALKALIQSHGKDPAVFDGFLVMLGELRYPFDDDMVELILKQHLTNPKMGQLCFELMYRSSESWARKLLEETAARHPQKAVRGQALYALGIYHRHRAQPYSKKITEAEQDKRFAQAAKYFTEVTKSYAAITTPDGKNKLGDKAVSELIRIKNLPNLRVGKTAPEIVGEDIDGKKFTLSDYRGKVVLLDFWGHW